VRLSEYFTFAQALRPVWVARMSVIIGIRAVERKCGCAEIDLHATGPAPVV
jgi:hypothetical protein